MTSSNHTKIKKNRIEKLTFATLKEKDVKMKNTIINNGMEKKSEKREKRLRKDGDEKEEEGACQRP